MSGDVSRRTFLRGSLATAATVVGFDTVLRSWVSAAEFAPGAFALAEGFTSFDGSLLTDGASLAAAADFAAPVIVAVVKVPPETFKALVRFPETVFV